MFEERNVSVEVSKRKAEDTLAKAAGSSGEVFSIFVPRLPNGRKTFTKTKTLVLITAAANFLKVFSFP